MVRSDYIERQIRMLAAAIARALGLRRAGRLDEAEDELLAAIASAGGIDPRLVDLADPAMLAAQLGDVGRVAGIARLLAERGEVELARGDAARASATRRRALQLWLEAVLMGASLSGEDRARVEELIAGVGELRPRYAGAVEALRGLAKEEPPDTEVPGVH